MRTSSQTFEPLKTPVLFLIFNRLETTEKVFEAIRAARPPRLYVAADGPRSNRLGEDAITNRVREVATAVDWPCEVRTLFRSENLGCKNAVSNAITWFFENESEGIILEDDCLPSQSFFWFCEELLAKYRDDMRVWHIGGASTLNEEILLNSDTYYFSKFNHIWGWASWGNRWKQYDVNINRLPLFIKTKQIQNITSKKLFQDFWIDNFKYVYKNIIDTWDYQWYFTVWINSGLSIIPTKNLVSNIGFGVGATHTSNSNNKLANMRYHEIDLNINHPKIMMPNQIYDNYNYKYLFNLKYLIYYALKLKKYIFSLTFK